MRKGLPVFGLLGILSLMSACGGGGSSAGSPASAVAVTLDQPSASITVTRQRAFAATVTGASNAAVTWSVQEGATGGTVDAAGLYTAPATPGTYHLVARSVADPTRSANATLAILAAPAISAFTATPGEVLPGATVTLTATFTEGTALLNPGMTPMSSGTPVNVNPTTSTVYVLSVTNAAGTTVAAGAAVTVSGQVAVGVLPAAVTVEQGAPQSFQALVSGTTNQAVTWSVQEGVSGGSVSASGLYTPPARGGSYHVVATSVLDPAKQAVATVTVPRAWQPTVILSAPGEVGLYPILAGNEGGDLLVVWGRDGLRSRFYSGSTGTWGTEWLIGGPPTNAQTATVTLEADGTGRVLFLDLPYIKSSRWTGSAWEAAEAVHTLPGAGTFYSLALATEPGGTALAAWRESGTSLTLWGSGRTAGGWSTPQRLDLYSSEPTGPKVTLRAGLGWVAWMQSDGSFSQVFTAKWNGTALETATQRSSVPPAGYPRPYSGPALGMRDDGTTYVTYQQLPSVGGAPDSYAATYNPGLGTWSHGLQEISSGGVQWSGVPNRGPRALRLWTHDEGAGFTFTAERQSISPFTSLGPQSGFVASDLATTGLTGLVWQEAGNTELPNRLVGVIYDHLALAWGPRTVLTTYTSSYFTPAIAVAGDGRAAAVWSTFPPGGGSAQVQVRHYR